jgi:hypothetical protein
MKLEFSEQIFEKYSNNKFYENSSSARWGFPCGWTDKHDEANSHFSQFCGRAWKWFKSVKGLLQSLQYHSGVSRLLKINSPSRRSVVMLESVMNSLLNTDTLLPYVRCEAFTGVKICVVWPYGVLHCEFYQVGKYITSNTVERTERL